MNAIYDSFKDRLLNGDGFSWKKSTIRMAAVSDSYKPKMSKDSVLVDIPSSAVIAMSEELKKKTVSRGVLDADDVDFVSIGYGKVFALVLFEDSAGPASSHLIAYLDEVKGLPWSAAGARLVVNFDNGPNKIMRF